ncbi:hypothetical protein [Streptomyces sp. NPDC005374]|uniref:VMAP-C domain-containing protein n=1 Tax=Streptomyces sp. NPDC005374 TaxID=3364713 RepID=UPI003681036A
MIADLDRIHTRIGDDVVEALLGGRVLAPRTVRAMLIDELRKEAGHVPEPDENLPPRMWFLQLVRSCTPDDESCLLPHLVKVLDRMDPGSHQTLTVHRLADEWNALAALPLFAPKWDWLQRKLSGDAAEAVRFATGGRVTVAPSHCRTAWNALHYLVGHTALPSGGPPWMRLMMRLWKQTSGETEGRELYALTRLTVGKSLALAAQLDLLVPQAPIAAAERQQTPDYLIIGIAHDDRSSDRYRVSYWLQAPGDPMPLPGVEHRTADRQGLEVAVDEMISLAEREEGIRLSEEELQLEIVLPLELLNLPVHGWSVGRPGPQAELAAHYQVVLRSLDRLRNHNWHRVWRQRWAQLHEPSPKHKFMDPVDFPPGPGDLTRLVAQLKEEKCVAVVLSGPPEHERSRGRREAEAALLTGTPVLVWHRTKETNEEFRNYVLRLLRPRLTELPGKVTDARRHDLAEAQDSPSRHLAVLWDDPDRNPYAPPLNPFALDDSLGSGAL